jgi:hypothetical protein
MTRSLAGLLVTVLLGACGGSKKPPPTPTPPPPVVKPTEGVVTVEVDPPDAEVDIDGAPRGAASSLGGTLTLTRGTHQIVLHKPGFEIWRGEVEVQNQTEKLTVTLVPQK